MFKRVKKKKIAISKNSFFAQLKKLMIVVVKKQYFFSQFSLSKARLDGYILLGERCAKLVGGVPLLSSEKALSL
ncbi:hypothetical protein [Salegentibacter sp. 24]|uniref:hypothetical protein n=1 Tax=Salegentibacter sp. 24 TaxID=2183986 RepID=UPI0014150018|nr:hypothetical protein [Salegentibacter sp. 24]